LVPGAFSFLACVTCPPASSPLFPYTTLFRSAASCARNPHIRLADADTEHCQHVMEQCVERLRYRRKGCCDGRLDRAEKAGDVEAQAQSVDRERQVVD